MSEELRQRVLGDTLTHLLDRRLALYHELITVDGEIYQELVNRLQSQIGSVVVPVLERIAALEERAVGE